MKASDASIFSPETESMIEAIMDQNERPISPLMRKLQESLEREGHAVTQKATVARQVSPPVMPAPVYSRTPAAAPAVPRPNFTSAAISKGNYIEPLQKPDLPDPAFAEEDMTDEELKANSRSHRGGLVLASAVILAGAAAIGAFIFILSPQQEAALAVPEIMAAPEPIKAPAEVSAPTLRTIEPVAQAPNAAAPVSMGDVSSELVAPTTDGLSPARRIGTTRILLDGDNEIKP